MPARAYARTQEGKERPFSVLPPDTAWAPQRTNLLARGGTFEGRRRHEAEADDCRRYNVEVTGTLRQGAARCRISNGAVRPLAATCPSRLFC